MPVGASPFGEEPVHRRWGNVPFFRVGESCLQALLLPPWHPLCWRRWHLHFQPFPDRVWRVPSTTSDVGAVTQGQGFRITKYHILVPGTGGPSPRCCTRLPPLSRSGPKAPWGGGGGGGGGIGGGGSGRGDGGGREGRLGGGVQVGQFGVGGGGAQAPVTSPCHPSGVRARARGRARVRVRVRVSVRVRVRVTELVEPVLVL